MGDNSRVREKFELSLDGRQIASIVLGALVVLGVVFVLGLSVGRQLALRQAEASRRGDLDALDRVPSATPAVAQGGELTFPEKISRARPAPPPPLEARPVASAPVTPAPQPLAAPAAAPATPSAPRTGPVTDSAPAPAPAAALAPKPPAPSAAAKALAAAKTPPAAAPPVKPGAWSIQLAASADRTEAEKLAAKWKALGARVEPGEKAGKKVFRVRAGSYDSKEAAERALPAVSGQAGAKGFAAKGP